MGRDAEVVRGRKEIMAVLGLGRRKFDQLKGLMPVRHDGYRFVAVRAKLLAWYEAYTSERGA